MAPRSPQTQDLRRRCACFGFLGLLSPRTTHAAVLKDRNVFSHESEASSPKSQCQQGHAPSEGKVLGKIDFIPRSELLGLPAVLGWQTPHSSAASLVTQHPPEPPLLLLLGRQS